MEDAEGLRLINAGRKAALEETLLRLNKLIEIESFNDAEKLEKLKSSIERDIGGANNE